MNLIAWRHLHRAGFPYLTMKLSYDVYCPNGAVERNLPPVIMMHGMMDSRKTWKYLAPPIANRTGRKVYAVDARNHGESPWNENMSFNINAEDLHGFMEQQGIPRATIVGHSMGGRTAMKLALDKPECVEKIVVEDMVLRDFKPHQSGLMVEIINMLKESLNHIPPGADERTAKKAIISYLRSLFSQDEEKTPKRTSSTRYSDMSMIPLKRDGATYSWQTNLDVLVDMLTTEKIRQKLEGCYTGDALFIHGTKSFFKVQEDLLLPKVFPNATLLAIEKATHLVHFEFPEKFIEEVSSFINGGKTNVLKAKY